MEPLDLFRQGIAVIPIRYMDKRPLLDWLPFQTTLPTQCQWQAWQGRPSNWAAVCGWQGLTVLDFDNMDAYGVWFSWARLTGGAACQAAGDTYKVLTSRGVHVYLFVDETPRCYKFGLIDVKGVGGYVLIPPSIHPSGRPYRALDSNAPILRVGTLAEVIPFAPPHTESATSPRLVPADPWQSAATTFGPCNWVHEIRSKVSILSLFPDALPNGGNRWWVTCCPFHDDRNPSFWIDTQLSLCGCHAGCTPKPLDVINLYARLKSISNTDAIAALKHCL